MQPSILPSSRISSGDDDYSGPKLVILGATGYVGAAFVETLAQIDHGYNVVAIHRSTFAAPTLQALNLQPIRLDLHDLADVATLSQLARTADCVLNLASSALAADAAVARAVLMGLEARARDGILRGQRRPMMVQLSGIESFARVTEEGLGELGNSKVLSDLKYDLRRELLVDLHQTAVENMILSAGSGGLITTKVLFAGLVYGRKGALSPQIASLVNLALARGQVACLSDGQSSYPHVHIDSLIQSLLRLIDIVPSSSNVPAINGWPRTTSTSPSPASSSTSPSTGTAGPHHWPAVNHLVWSGLMPGTIAPISQGGAYLASSTHHTHIHLAQGVAACLSHLGLAPPDVSFLPLHALPPELADLPELQRRRIAGHVFCAADRLALLVASRQQQHQMEGTSEVDGLRGGGAGAATGGGELPTLWDCLADEVGNVFVVRQRGR